MRRTIHRGRLIGAALTILLAGLACGPLVASLISATPTATPGIEFAANLPTSDFGATVTPLATLPMLPPQATPTAAPTATPSYPWLTGDIRVYPGPLHYSGDILSVEVAIKNGRQLPAIRSATLSVDGGNALDIQPFLAESVLRDDVLVFHRAWDTAGIEGLHRLSVVIPSADGREPLRLQTQVLILPASERPPQEIGARWEIRDTACCTLRFLTRTAAARDIFTLSDKANQATDFVERRLGFGISRKPISLAFIDSMWGNGAYTRNEIVISYVDRAYDNVELETLLRHEITHIGLHPLEEGTPVILAEGAAVYVAGGHYKPEPLGARGAALLQMGELIPIDQLADAFREQQHEIAYIEAGSLVQYLAERYGWGKFLAVYSATNIKASGAAWLNEAFKQQYGKSLGQIEQEYRAWLKQQPADAQIDDVRLTIALANTFRRYQNLYAPYEETLPDSAEASQANITAEFMREPTAPENIALETMLVSAGHELFAGHYDRVTALLSAINAVLDTGDFSGQPAADYIGLARAVSEAGYQAQSVDLNGDQASVRAIRDWPRMVTLNFVRGNTGWQLASLP